MSFSDSNYPVPFLNTTEVFPEDESQLRIKLTDVYSTTANAINVRDVAIYDLLELQTGQQFFDPEKNQETRPTLRKVFQLGAKAVGGTYTIPHDITRLVTFTRMYGTCITNPLSYLPIPYADVTNVTNQVSLYADAANLYVVNGATADPIVSGIVVLEYILG